MFLPHCYLFSLSNELIVEIISNLCPVDIHACQCTCRRLNGVIINSYLIQYIKRTALNGLFDPLEPGLSLPDRLDILERWETAWMEMDLREPNAIIDAPVHAEGPTMRDRRFLSGQYLIMKEESIGGLDLYSFLDMHATSSSHSNAARWTTIEIDFPVLSFAFATELDLVITFSELTSFHHHAGKTVAIRPLQFSTGEPHPLAPQPHLEISVSGLAAQYVLDVTVIGDYILYCVGGSYGDESDSQWGIYLVAWKEGWISELRVSPSMVYSPSLSVLSEEMILLVRLHEPALELCRLSNIDDREKASLEIVRILSLPVLAANTSLSTAVCFSEHPDHVLFSKNQQHTSLHPHPPLSSSSGLSTQQPEGGIDTRHHLYSVPVDDIIVVQMHFDQSDDSFVNSYLFDLAVRRRTLLEFSNSQAQAGAVETGIGAGVGTAAAVPWKKWGPNKAHFLKHDSPMFPSSHFGERRMTAQLGRGMTIRDYNPFRVQRALKLFGGAEKEVTLECGSIVKVVKVVKEKLVYPGGELFCDNIETILPYVKTVVPHKWCHEILMDKDNLVFVRTGMSLDEVKFIFHFL